MKEFATVLECMDGLLQHKVADYLHAADHSLAPGSFRTDV
jgi:hypothetical protein